MIVTYKYFQEKNWKEIRRLHTVCAISGIFSPLHVGHIKYIVSASKLADYLVIILNGDLSLKTMGKPVFMKEFERALIVNQIKGVDCVTIFNGSESHVSKPLGTISPNIFAQGGPLVKLPEEEQIVCDKLGIEVKFGVGGIEKLSSSSELLDNLNKFSNNA